VALAKKEIDRSESRAISIVTWMDVMVGTNAKTEAQTRGFLAKFQVLTVTQVVAGLAVKLQRENKMKLPDVIIAATAQTSGRHLITRNARDFGVGSGSVRVPYRL